MPKQTIRFTEGISRYENAGLNTARGIRNARIEPFGDIHAVRQPTNTTTSFNGNDVPSETSEKPWFYWNNNWITSEDADNGSIVSGDDFNGILYTSNGDDGSGTPEVKLFLNNYDGTSSTTESAPAQLVSLDNLTELGPANISNDTYVSYIIIPFNNRDEAGPYWYESYVNTTGSGETPKFFFTSNDQCSYIEVFRTRERDLDGHDEDNIFYFLGRFQKNVESTNNVQFTDRKQWRQTNDEAGQGPEDLRDEINKDNLFTYDRSKNLLERIRDDNSEGTTGQSVTTGYRSPAAQTIHNDGGTMYYGNVTWPTKQPQLVYDNASVGAASEDRRVAFQYEYSTEAGKSYGPPLEVPINTAQTNKFEVAYQGEQALIVWYWNGTNWGFVERLTPNEFGRYVTDDGDASGGQITFTDAGTVGEDTGESYPYTISDYVQETNRVLLSEVNRPWEITQEGVSTRDDTEIRDISPARLAEEESVISYDTYISTDKGIFVSTREGRNIRTFPAVDRIGIKQNDSGLEVKTLIPQGLAFYGTDNQIHVLSGRDIQQIDRKMSGLWSDVIDMDYNKKRNELWCVTNGGIWIYSFEFGMWLGQRDVDDKQSGQDSTSTVDIDRKTGQGLFEATRQSEDSFDDENVGAPFRLEDSSSNIARGYIAQYYGGNQFLLDVIYDNLSETSGLTMTFWANVEADTIFYWEEANNTGGWMISAVNDGTGNDTIYIFDENDGNYKSPFVGTQAIGESSRKTSIDEIEVDYVPLDSDSRPIVDVDTVGEIFYVSGNVEGLYTPGQTFNVINSTGNDGAYTVRHTVHNAGTDRTQILVQEDITDSTADGTIEVGNVLTVRHAIEYEEVVDATKSPPTWNATWTQSSYNPGPAQIVYPKLHGRRHLISAEGFRSFRSFSIESPSLISGKE